MVTPIGLVVVHFPKDYLGGNVTVTEATGSTGVGITYVAGHIVCPEVDTGSALHEADAPVSLRSLCPLSDFA